MKFLRLLLLSLWLPGVALAQTVGNEIGNYPNANALTGTERIPADQAAVFPRLNCTVNLDAEPDRQLPARLRRAVSALHDRRPVLERLGARLDDGRERQRLDLGLTGTIRRARVGDGLDDQQHHALFNDGRAADRTGCHQLSGFRCA